MAATTIFLNARRIHTMDDQYPDAEAIAIENNKILAVGTRAEIEALADDNTEVIDLSGKVLLPGFVEAHGHPTSEMAFIGPDSIDIRAAIRHSAEGVLEALREGVAEAEASGDPDAWVTAFGWDPLLLPDLPEISGAFLTELSPTIPLSVMHYSAHKSWANDAALKRLGINKATANPGASEYIRDDQGNPTGEALEIPASMILMGPAMEVTEDRFDEFLDNELQRISKVGVTTTGDLAFHPDNYSMMEKYVGAGKAIVRMRAYEMSGLRENVPPIAEAQAAACDPEIFRQVGMKVWTDGSPWVGNIETSFGYEDSEATRSIGIEPGHKGCSNYTRDQLSAICREHFANGWQMACHVHGDIAVDMVLDVFEEIQEEFCREDGRLRMEHCGTITPEQVRRAHKLGVAISFFVAHIQYYGDVLLELFGERANLWTPAGTAEEVGMPFSLHNDPPVTPEFPLGNIEAAVTRRAPSGKILGPEQRTSRMAALRAETIDAAWQIFSEHEVGSLTPGKFADLVILADDPLEVPEDEISKIQVLETWLGGKAVYHAC